MNGVETYEITNKEFRVDKEVLCYLVNHPDAQDTLEGILRWWLLEQTVKFNIEKVRMVIDQLVREQLLTRHDGADLQVSYRINAEKYDAILALLKQG